MGNAEVWLEFVLVILLGATLVHAIRLQRVIGVLRADRTHLDQAVAGFDIGARQAEAGLARLREAAQRLGGDMDQAGALRDDLALLSERGAQIADRLDALVRASRGLEPPPAPAPPAYAAPLAPPPPHSLPDQQPVRSQAERDLLLALRGRR